MGKKFVGLDGLKHFWTKAKTWITAQITSEVTAKIAELVANAPEDLNTLKEIADWISAHADDASAMNTAINTNKTNITNHINNKSNPHGVTKAQVGLENVGNFKAVSTVASQRLTDTEKSNARTNIGAGTSSFSGSYNDLTNKPSSFTPSSHTHDYLPLSGGAMTGNIKYKGSKNTYDAIKFIDNTEDSRGNGISIGAGGLTIIGGGESSDTVAAQQTSGSDEKMIIANDQEIDFYTNTQSGFSSAKHITMNTDGTITAAGFNGTATKAAEVLDYGNTSETVKVGYSGPSIQNDNLLALAGYTERIGSSVKLKDVSKTEAKKWLEIPTKTSELTNNSGFITSRDRKSVV